MPQRESQTANLNPQTWTIAASAWDVACRALESVYPNEGCGLLIASRKQPQHIIRAHGVKNSIVSTERFEMDPLGYQLVEKSLSKDDVIAGIFHSHPDAEAQPSKSDLNDARGLYEFTRQRYLYLNVPVRKHEVNGRAWQLDEALNFHELQFTIV